MNFYYTQCVFMELPMATVLLGESTIEGILYFLCFRWCSKWWTNCNDDGSRSAGSGWRRDDGWTTAAAAANDDASGTWRDYWLPPPIANNRAWFRRTSSQDGYCQLSVYHCTVQRSTSRHWCYHDDVQKVSEAACQPRTLLVSELFRQ